MKTTILKSVMMVLVALFSLNANAYDAYINGIYYNFNKETKTAEITNNGGLISYPDDIVIPSSVESDGIIYSVTSIGDNAFARGGMTSVVIPNSITSIGAGAFYKCRSLTSVTIPESVTSIGRSAFIETAWLDNQEDGLIYINNLAFLYKGTMPENTSITIKDGTISICAGAFNVCTGLTSIDIPSSVISIGSAAFNGCTGLTSIDIPSSVISIGSAAFSGCTGLTSIEIPYGITSLDNGVFSLCSGLTVVNIPASVTSIEEGAFYGCSGLTSLTIPKSVKSIGRDAFGNCTGLNSIHITDLTTWCNILYDVRYTKNGVTSGNPLQYAHHLYLNGEEVKDLIIPDGVTSINESAFQYCSGLTSVTFPNSVTSINGGAFSDCENLASIVIPNSVTYIGMGAFDRTAWLTNQDDGLLYAGNVAYKYKGNMPLDTKITINDGTTAIGSEVFYRCNGLTSVVIPKSVTSIGTNAFYGCSSLTSVEIPNSVTSIESMAFSGCNNLGSLTISNSVKSLDNSVFQDCNSLNTIIVEIIDFPTWCSTPLIFNIPTSYTCKISLNGKTIQELVIPEGVTSIGKSAFRNCSDLTSLFISNSVTTIEEDAFEGCNSLTSSTIEIKDVDSWCSNPLLYSVPVSCNRYLSLDGKIVEDLVIPQSVTSIGNSAFREYRDFTSVKVEWSRPLAGGANSFEEDVKKNAPLYVPKGTAMMYMSAPGWSEFVNILEYEDGEDAHYITIRMGDGGVLKQSVEVGQTYTYAVSADEGWEVNTLTFDGKDMTSLLMDGQFSTPVITSSAELNVVFKQIDTNVKEMPSMSDVKVYASNKSITVTGAEENEQVLVYGINGLPVASAVGNTSFSLESGVYIVKVGEETFKVRL